MIKFAPTRVARFLSSEAPFKGGATSAVMAIKQSAPQIVHNTPAPVVNNGAVKFLSSMIVAIVKPFKSKFMPAIEKKIAPIVEKQGAKTLKAVKTGSENLSNKSTGFTKEIGSGFSSLVEDFKKSAEKKSDNFLRELKEFSESTRATTKESTSKVKDLVNKGKETVSRAKEEKKSFFDKLVKEEKNIEQQNLSKNNSLTKKISKEHKTRLQNETSQNHIEVKKELTTKKAEKPSIDKKINGEKLKTSKLEQKPLKNKKSVVQKTVRQEHISIDNTAEVSGNNPFAKIKSVKAESQAIPHLEKNMTKIAEKTPKSNAVSNPFAENIKPPSLLSELTNDVKLEIESINRQIEAPKLNQNPLKTESGENEILPAKLVKSAKKKHIKLGQKIKTKQAKKYRKLPKNNYVGHKSFASIKGKGGLLKKEQYSPDGKLERTIINKGNGLIEIKEANSNKIYYMRDGKIIEKSVLEQQENAMKKLAFAVNMANGKTEIQGLVRSYAKKCGMKEVNKTVMINGKSANIIYEGFGFSITADGRVLAKEFSFGNNVFYSDMFGVHKVNQHTTA